MRCSRGGFGLALAPLAAAALSLGLGACTVGSGAGSAKGNIFVLGCGEQGEDYNDAAFDLSPDFFAGEPIEDTAQGGVLTNRLLIRMQRTGNRIEVNDTLYFDVRNVYEVARCLRGRTVNGVPDWDTTGWCDWTGGAGGAVQSERPRILMGPDFPVSSSLSLLFTCNKARVMGVAVDGSWIDFLAFGKAAQPQLTDRELREKVIGDFKVEFGDRLQANFNVVLDDERRVAAIQDMEPIPQPLIGGTLGGTPETGSFDFDLDRSRAAQPFP